jgi:hypothetical protein
MARPGIFGEVNEKAFPLASALEYHLLQTLGFLRLFYQAAYHFFILSPCDRAEECTEREINRRE